MRMPSLRPLSLFVAILAGSASATAQQVPSPKEFLGQEVGADHYLCNDTDMMRYFRAVEAATPRVRIREIGTSGYGRTMHLAVITSPRNQERIEQLRATSRRLMAARDTDEAVVQRLAAEGTAVVWIDAGMHSTEAIAAQNIIELVWQMASRTDPEVMRILDNVVLLACPANPDGQEMVANAYAATRTMNIPVLYQRYSGHDNNRDYYANNCAETRNISRQLYIEWCPQILYNHHQTSPPGTILFTPPFRDPHNYNLDPMVVRGIEIVSAHMNHRFAREGKPGIISRGGAPYSAWWNGGLRTTTYYHNIIGILTEAFGRPEPTPIKPALERRLATGEYPDYLPAQVWHARQTIEYLQTANFAILDYAARHKDELLHGVWRMGRNSIERGSRDHWTATPWMIEAAKVRGDEAAVFSDPLLRDPRAWLLRPDQRDRGAMVRFLQALQSSGIEIHRATSAFGHGGATFPEGTIVVRADQAFRPHVIDMFEPQWHPDDFRDGKPVPPYDAAGWTYAMQCDIEFVRVLDGIDGPFERVAGMLPFAGGDAPASGPWRIDPADTNAFVAVNRLLARGVAIEWSPRGHWVVPAADGVHQHLQVMASELGVRFESGFRETREARRRVAAPRVGIFDVYGGHMPTAWDQLLLDRFGFAWKRVWGSRIPQGRLREDFDVLVFHTGLPGGRSGGRQGQRPDAEVLQAIGAAMPAFADEDWSDVLDRATPLVDETCWPALEEFVAQGGTLVALGNEAEKVVARMGLPVRVGMQVPDGNGGMRRAEREDFYVPGSVMGLEVDLQHPLAAGTTASPAAMFTNNSPVFWLGSDASGVEVVARWHTIDTLRSGWALGEEHLAGKPAVVRVPRGTGSVLLCSADVTYRAQPLGTIKLFLQALLQSALR